MQSSVWCQSSLTEPLGLTHLYALLPHDIATLVKSDNSMNIFIEVAPIPLALVLEKRNIGLDKSPNNEQGEKTLTQWQTRTTWLMCEVYNRLFEDTGAGMLLERRVPA